MYGSSIVRNISSHAREISTICLPGGKLKTLERNLADPDIYDILKIAPTIILHAGGNDAANGSSIDTICSDLRKLIHSVKSLFPSAHIIISGILLRKDITVNHALLLNSSIAKMLNLENICFIDPNHEFQFSVVEHALGRDGIHLNYNGVAELGRIFAKFVHKMSGNWMRQYFPRFKW